MRKKVYDCLHKGAHAGGGGAIWYKKSYRGTALPPGEKEKLRINLILEKKKIGAP